MQGLGKNDINAGSGGITLRVEDSDIGCKT